MKAQLSILFSLLAISLPALAMESPTHRENDRHRMYIDVDSHFINYYVGAPSRFYGEYRARNLDNGLVSFPVSACDPLPLNTFGTIKYFFTSAMQGHILQYGLPIQIADPNISDMVVVRAKNDATGTRAEFYLGYNKDSFQIKGKKKIYKAQPLFINVKSRQDANPQTYSLASSRWISPMDLSSEARKQLTNLKQFDWKNSEFQKGLLALLGEGWQVSNRDLDTYFTNYDGAIIKNGLFHSEKVYWNQYVNALKGISYTNK